MATGLFFISESSSAASTINSRLLHSYPDASPHTSRWVLNHALFRSTPSNPPDNSPFQHQHVLNLGHYPGKTFIAITSPVSKSGTDIQDGATVISVPFAQTEQYLRLMFGKFGALWVQRAQLGVQNGWAYDVGDWTVRVGELKQAGQPGTLRGTVVFIQHAGSSQTGNEENGQDEKIVDQMSKEELEEYMSEMQATIREMWSGFGEEGAREFFSVPDPAGGKNETFEEVKVWCEMLRSVRG
ncbi:hypothetical protein M501DRAFT_1033393 [Patellaria atrata CBS 101060]|uniref:Mediator of RNA polymerase II transcription subunit 20 n=1 Tax=Patellaria atrata CBS 101060 TaxID=1346257 RepID=A0A9P4S811_9PEZI|nr:hypothetical protein M501DRAFT_1033393 [Patellaria atrata CBS 101060]